MFCLSFQGIKVIGGVKELTGEEYGVYVKRILPGGLASSDGKFSHRFFITVYLNIYPCGLLKFINNAGTSIYGLSDLRRV